MQTLQISDKAAEQLNILAAQEHISSGDLIERMIAEYHQETDSERQGNERLRKNKALAILDKHQGLYDGVAFNRDEVHERS